MSGRWIKRKPDDGEHNDESSRKKQKTVHHPPFLPEPKRPGSEWDTAESAVELVTIFGEKKEAFENDYVEAFPSEWEESLTGLVGSEHSESMTKVVFELTQAEFQELLLLLFRMVRDYTVLCQDAKKIHEWIESREPYHFKDDVNDEESIRGEICKLEETIGGYYDDVLSMESVMDAFVHVMSASSSLLCFQNTETEDQQEQDQEEQKGVAPE